MKGVRIHFWILNTPGALYLDVEGAKYVQIDKIFKLDYDL